MENVHQRLGQNYVLDKLTSFYFSNDIMQQERGCDSENIEY